VEKMNLGRIEHQFGRLSWARCAPSLQHGQDPLAVEGADNLDLGASRLVHPDLEGNGQEALLSRLSPTRDVLRPDAEQRQARWRTDVPIRQRSFYGRFSFSAARFPAALALASHMNSPRFVFPQLPLSAK
jgi:hypothetical protein